MAQKVKVLASKSAALSLVWWKERTDSYPLTLPFDLHMCTLWHMFHRHIHCEINRNLIRNVKTAIYIMFGRFFLCFEIAPPHPYPHPKRWI